MTDFSSSQASDPATSPSVLAQIAYERPDLRAAVAANPSAYPELLTWLEGFSDPAVNAAIAARRAAQAGTSAPTAPVDPTASADHAPPAGFSQEANQQASPYGQQGEYAARGRGPGAAYEQQVQNFAHDAGPGGGEQHPNPAGYGQQPPHTGGYPLYGGADHGPRKKRKGLLIGGIIGAVAILGVGGAVLANQLLFSKIKPAASPEDAATKMIEAIADKDALSVYGSLSPAEFEHMKVQYDSFKDNIDDTDYGTWSEDYEKLLDQFDVTLEGLDVRVETVEDGLAKVFLTDGKMTIDGNSDEIARLLTDMSEEVRSSPLFAQIPTTDFDPNEFEADTREDLDRELPFTVEAKSLRTSDGSDGFLMAVEEDGGWFISPYITLAEYMFVESDGTVRGSLPAADVVKEFTSPEAAAQGLTDASLAFLKTGDLNELVGALPLAERRLLALYGETGFEGFGSDVDQLEVTSKEFAVRSEDDGLAHVTFKDFGFTIDEGYEKTSVGFKGTCVSGSSTSMTPFELCVDEVPLLKEFGLQDLSFIALEEDGSWFVSPTATVTDAALVFSSKMLGLYQDGRFEDQQWLEQQMLDFQRYVESNPGLAEIFGGSAGASPYDSGSDWDF